jgi:hypothetical protein
MVTEALSAEWTKLKRLSNICDTNGSKESLYQKTGRTWFNSGPVQLGELLNCRRNWRPVTYRLLPGIPAGLLDYNDHQDQDIEVS